MPEEVEIEVEGPEDEAPLDIAPGRRSVKTEKLDIPAETLNGWVNRGAIEPAARISTFLCLE